MLVSTNIAKAFSRPEDSNQYHNYMIYIELNIYLTGLYPASSNQLEIIHTADSYLSSKKTAKELVIYGLLRFSSC